MISQFKPLYFLLSEHTAENQGMWEAIVQSNIINFVIAAAALLWIFKRFNLASILDKRQEAIIKALKEAEEKRDSALLELKKIEERAAKLTGEVDKMLKEAQATAESVSDTIIKNAEAEADKILENAKKRIALEEKNAVRELEQRLMREAIHGARELLENTLSVEDKQQSVQDFVNRLPDLVSTSEGQH